MLKTRFTPDGKQKQKKINGLQVTVVLLCGLLIVGFCTFGLGYMFIPASALATPVPTVSPTPVPTPVSTPSPKPTAKAAVTPTPTVTPEPTPTPFATVLTEDAENGKWYYETENIKIEIERTYPKDKVVATVAVITLKTGEYGLKTAFAGGSYAENLRLRTSEIAESAGAVFAINGDYCSFRSDGIILREGNIIRDNPAREALVLFSDGHIEVMNERETNAEKLMETGATDSWSFGPILVKDGILPSEFHTDVKRENPRTALGQTADGRYVCVVVDGRGAAGSIGLGIEDLAQYMLDLGCVNAYNLDGGMTSCMVFNGQVISTPCGTANKERPLSDIIYIPME